MKSKSNNFKKIFYILNNFEIYVATFIMIIMTALLFIQVVSRYVLKHAIVWTEELSIIFFVWVIYLGISSCTKDGGHLRIDILPNALKPKQRKILLLFTDLVVIAFCIYVIPPLISITLAQGNTTSVMLKIPMKVGYGIIPFGMGLTAIRGIQSFVKNMRQNPEDIKPPEDPTIKDMIGL